MSERELGETGTLHSKYHLKKKKKKKEEEEEEDEERKKAKEKGKTIETKEIKRTNPWVLLSSKQKQKIKAERGGRTRNLVIKSHTLYRLS